MKLIYRILALPLPPLSLCVGADRVQDQSIIRALWRIVDRPECDAIEIQREIGFESFLAFFEHESESFVWFDYKR